MKARGCLHFHHPKRVLGLTFIFTVAAIWVVASFVVQDIQSDGVSAAVLTYIANSLFAVYLPIYWLNLRLRKQLAAKQEQQQEQAALVPAGAQRSDASMAQPLALDEAGSDGGGGKGEPDMTWQQLLRSALVVGPLWYMAQFTFNLSLAHTSVTSNTVLSSTSSLFTFLISVWLLHEAFTLKKLACIFLLIAGTAVFTLADTTSSGAGAKDTLWGDLLVLLSAVLYAAYTVAIRKSLTDDDHVSMTLFFGLTGVVICLGLGPVLLLFWLGGAGLGTLTWKTLGLVVAKGLLDNVLSDYLWARAILLIGPTVATAGLSMQIPIAVGLDVLVRHPAWLGRAGPAVLTFLGVALVVTGFLGINLSSEKEEEEAELQEVESHCELEGLSSSPLPLPREGPLAGAAVGTPRLAPHGGDAGGALSLVDAPTEELRVAGEPSGAAVAVAGRTQEAAKKPGGKEGGQLDLGGEGAALGSYQS